MNVVKSKRKSGAQNGKTLILASQSPRRLQLLRQIGLDPLCLPVDIDESALPGETAQAMVQRLASMKATTCRQQPGFTALPIATDTAVLLGADTIIELDGEILGKPTDEAHAVSMLQALSDREHAVHSGVCVLMVESEQADVFIVSTQIRFAPIDWQLARRYWRSGEPQGKAGGYAIQGLGAQFVVNLAGSYSNAVGLPLFETSRALERAGLTSF